MIIRNRTARLLIPEGVRLLPGLNDLDKMGVPEATQQRIQQNEQFRFWKKAHWVTVQGASAADVSAVAEAAGARDENFPPPIERPLVASVEAPILPEAEQESEPEPEPEPEPEEKAPPASLESKNVIAARAAIVACEDPELLLQWHLADKRKTVQEAIEARISALESQK